MVSGKNWRALLIPRAHLAISPDMNSCGTSEDSTDTYWVEVMLAAQVSEPHNKLCGPPTPSVQEAEKFIKIFNLSIIFPLGRCFKRTQEFLQKTKHGIILCSHNPHLSRRIENRHSNTHACMFTAAPFNGVTKQK